LRRNPRQIFISHATADAELAHRLAADLQAEGWAVWMAPDSILPGEKWVEAINRGLAESGVFLLLLTPEAVVSRWVTTETNVAIGMEHRGLLKFIPLDVKPCLPPPLWTAYQKIDWQRNYEKGWQNLQAWLLKPMSKNPHMEAQRDVWRETSTVAHSSTIFQHEPDTRVLYIDERIVRLTKLENRMLRYFVEHANEVCTVEALLENVWGAGKTRSVVEKGVSRLREKIEVDPKRPRYLLSAWGEGYLLRFSVRNE
jgi:DNA-binding winged helix-turn-helix (wHTH) protein